MVIGECEPTVGDRIRMDRFLVFNGRCWLANRSLVDVGQATVTLIECVDAQTLIVKEIGRRWREAKALLD